MFVWLQFEVVHCLSQATTVASRKERRLTDRVPSGKGHLRALSTIGHWAVLSDRQRRWRRDRVPWPERRLPFSLRPEEAALRGARGEAECHPAAPPCDTKVGMASVVANSTVATSISDNSGNSSVVATTAAVSEVDGEQVKQAVYDFAVPLLVLACVISTVFNLLVLVSLRWLRRSINPTLSLSLSLTFADAYASFMLGLGFVVNSYLPLKNLGIGQCFNLILEALRLSGLVAAALNLLALSFNHYLGILRPLHYASTVTRRSAYIGIVLLWAVPLMLFFTYFSSVPGQGFQSTDCQAIA